jgi:hypothetical protein
MRLWLRVFAALAALAAAAVAAVGYVHRQRLTGQWMAYRVGRAANFEEACRALAWFEAGPDREARLRELVTRWATGNVRFDYYLARYVASPESSEAMRKRFSLELAWREGLLPRWAHWWSWRTGEQPDRRAEEILAFVELVLAAQDLSKEISWREILDLQAIFCLTGQPKWAERLTPANWRERYGQWRQARADGPLRITKPSRPLPDWEGPLPP